MYTRFSIECGSLMNDIFEKFFFFQKVNFEMYINTRDIHENLENVNDNLSIPAIHPMEWLHIRHKLKPIFEDVTMTTFLFAGVLSQLWLV